MPSETRGTASGNKKPTTLKEATAIARESRPLDTADAAAWLEYHRQNIRIFRHVSIVDVDHHFEALAWVDCEQKHADGLATGSAEHEEGA